MGEETMEDTQTIMEDTQIMEDIQITTITIIQTTTIITVIQITIIQTTITQVITIQIIIIQTITTQIIMVTAGLSKIRSVLGHLELMKIKIPLLPLELDSSRMSKHVISAATLGVIELFLLYKINKMKINVNIVLDY